MPADVQRDRLLRKVAKRDQRIAGLERRIKDLEHALAVKDVEVKRLPRDVTRAVQEALCNVRMIPVLGIGKDARILEVKASNTDAGKLRAAINEALPFTMTAGQEILTAALGPNEKHKRALPEEG